MKELDRNQVATRVGIGGAESIIWDVVRGTAIKSKNRCSAVSVEFSEHIRRNRRSVNLVLATQNLMNGLRSGCDRHLTEFVNLEHVITSVLKDIHARV